jgi:hypothetical protein
MHIVPDDDPVFAHRRFNSVSGSELTTGNVAKISNAVSDVLAEIDALHKRLDRLERRDESPKRTVVESQQ